MSKSVRLGFFALAKGWFSVRNQIRTTFPGRLQLVVSRIVPLCLPFSRLLIAACWFFGVFFLQFLRNFSFGLTVAHQLQNADYGTSGGASRNFSKCKYRLIFYFYSILWFSLQSTMVMVKYSLPIFRLHWKFAALTFQATRFAFIFCWFIPNLI
jgi:hypothetical protein